jgi:hypothetical protein
MADHHTLGQPRRSAGLGYRDQVLSGQIDVWRGL